MLSKTNLFSAIAALVAILVTTPHCHAQAADALPGPNARLRAGYGISLNVSVRGVDEAEMCGQFSLDSEGALELTVAFHPIEKIQLGGLTCGVAADRIAGAIRRYYAAKPDVQVTISHVPHIQVWAQGAVRLSGVVSLTQGARLSDLLAATGYLPTADLHRVRIERVDGGARIALLADVGRAIQSAGAADALNDPELKNGDLIDIEEGMTLAPPPQISVLGEVRRQGRLPFRNGMTVRDAVRDGLGLTPGADAERVTLYRHDGTLFTLNGTRVMEGIATDDLKLAPDDTVVVAARDTGRRYSVVGAVAAQQGFEYRGPVTISKAIADAGGFRPEADTRNVLILRNMLTDPAHVQPIVVSFDRLRRGEQPDVALQPGDMVQVPAKRRTDNSKNLLELGLSLLKLLL